MKERLYIAVLFIQPYHPCVSGDQSGQHLTGSLSHLSSLASEAPHALLSPLGTHATEDIKQHDHSVSLLDMALEKRTDQGAASMDDALVLYKKK